LRPVSAIGHQVGHALSIAHPAGRAGLSRGRMAAAARARPAGPACLSADRRRTPARAGQSTPRDRPSSRGAEGALRMSGLPTLIARAAAAMLPPGLSEWGRAMIAETEHGGGGWLAFRFALGCLRTAIAYRISSHLTQREPEM